MNLREMRVCATNYYGNLNVPHIYGPRGLNNTQRNIIGVAPPHRDKEFTRNFRNCPVVHRSFQEFSPDEHKIRPEKETCVWLMVFVKGHTGIDVLVEDDICIIMAGVAVIVNEENRYPGIPEGFLVGGPEMVTVNNNPAGSFFTSDPGGFFSIACGPGFPGYMDNFHPLHHKPGFKRRGVVR